MITRMKISGFKNLVDLDVHFDPFTCVAGANGVGKSNLFDAIIFLSTLAEKTLIEAAMSVRGEGGRAADVRHLFQRTGDQYAETMSFEVEMIIPHQGMDDYGQMAEASITSLRYAVSLAYRQEQRNTSHGRLELIYEKLERIKLGEASQHFLFPLTVSSWRKSAVRGRRRSTPFISTVGSGSERIIKMHQDSGGSWCSFISNKCGRKPYSLVGKKRDAVLAIIAVRTICPPPTRRTRSTPKVELKWVSSARNLISAGRTYREEDEVWTAKNRGCFAWKNRRMVFTRSVSRQ